MFNLKKYRTIIPFGCAIIRILEVGIGVISGMRVERSIRRIMRISEI